MSLKIIGAGLGRTGTMSLKLAIEQLGIGRCYHMAECFPNPAAPPMWVEAAKGRPDWEAIFDGFSATVDYPGCAFWRELSAAYPEAKIILTVRDADKWFESTQATIFSPPFIKSLLESPLAEFFGSTVIAEFSEHIHDRDWMTGYFKGRNAEVEAAFPEEKLLVYDVAQGWAPLCGFLGVAAPDTPFPRVNAREELAEMISAVNAEGEGGFVASLQATTREHFRKVEGQT